MNQPTLDYASAILGGEMPTPRQTASMDYASKITASPKQEQPLTFDELPIVNRDSSDHTAKFSTLTKAAMVDDPVTKLRIFARERFPDLPEKEALSRYGMFGGEVVYVSDDGKMYRETPPGFAGFAKEFAANIAGQAPAVIGGTVGGAMGVPGGPAGVVGGAALGAAGGKGYGKVLGNVVFDEPQSVGGNLKDMFTEAAFSGGGALLGVGVTKFLERNLARDIRKLDMGKVNALQEKAANVGGTGQSVDLNAAQLTNLPSVKGQAEALARLPYSADAMNEGLERTGQQAASAAAQYVDNISPTKSVRGAAEQARGGATKILDRIAQDRATASKPWYEKALSVTVQTDDELRKLAETPAFTQAMQRAQRIAANEGVPLQVGKDIPAKTAYVGGKTERVAAGHGAKTVELPGMVDAAGNPITREVPAQSSAFTMRGLHYIKLGLDDLIERGGVNEGIGATEKRAIVGVKNRLLSKMDAAAPDYARARSIYGHYMPTLKAQREGLLGQIAETVDTDLNAAVRQVFNPRNAPEDIARLRSMFYRYDQGDSWKALLSGYLRDTLESAGREFKTTGGVRAQAPTWRAAMVGDRKQAANLRAAMTADQWNSFTDMMDVFEAVGRVTGTGNSITQPMQEQARMLRNEAAGALPKLFAPIESVRSWLIEARLGKHSERLVELMNSPDSVRRLKALRQIPPSDKRFISGFASLFGVSASPASDGEAPLQRQ